MAVWPLAGTPGLMVDLSAAHDTPVPAWTSSDAPIAICVLFTQDGYYVLPDGLEVSTATLTIWLYPSVTCTDNVTGSAHMPGVRSAVDLRENWTLTLAVSWDNGTWLFRLHTLTREEYEPEYVNVLLSDALLALTRMWQQMLVACGAGAISGISLRRYSPRPEVSQDSVKEEPKKGEGSESYYIEAPVTPATLVYRARLYLFVLVVLVALVVLPVPWADAWPVVIGYVSLVVLSWWLAKDNAGFAIDCRNMKDGFLDMREIERWEEQSLMTRCITYASPLGTVILQGHRLYTSDRLASELEVTTNSRLIEDIAAFQSTVLPEYHKLKRTTDLEVQRSFNEEVAEWKQTMGIRTGSANRSAALGSSESRGPQDTPSTCGDVPKT